MTWIPQNSAGHLISRTARVLSRMADSRLRDLGVAAGQIPVFAVLQDGSSLSQTALARIARVEQPTMAATLARMERDGLIRREPDPADGRGSLVRLTPAALAKGPAIKMALCGLGEEALSGFNETERALLADMLQRIVANLEKTVPTEE
jgi:DNA-binding MarR family transcriptional regulator